jgi:hypothetical protein
MRWPVNPLRGEPSTGKPCAGDPPARFGGRGDRTQSVLPTPILSLPPRGNCMKWRSCACQISCSRRLQLTLPSARCPRHWRSGLPVAEPPRWSASMTCVATTVRFSLRLADSFATIACRSGEKRDSLAHQEPDYCLPTVALAAEGLLVRPPHPARRTLVFRLRPSGA